MIMSAQMVSQITLQTSQLVSRWLRLTFLAVIIQMKICLSFTNGLARYSIDIQWHTNNDRIQLF
ncbi:hypothetical protein CWM47_16425 [Spirosoma pollinicola]|uniref:Uncharacterized protein n=1 Tax=Spirosoma pollinicola TaxID=2057025 RepID=A0A2K8Z0E3_9BACT|nr:hypothetical protein CWM47_16425 [Spirosoma pollinicola]